MKAIELAQAAGGCAGSRTRAGPGRPRDPAKNDAIQSAARESFLEKGFHASTIEDIAARAGVSKVTLYNRFGDKEALFDAMVRGEVGRMNALFEPSMDEPMPLSDRLTAIGTALLEMLFEPDHVRFDRLISGEIAQSPSWRGASSRRRRANAAARWRRSSRMRRRAARWSSTIPNSRRRTLPRCGKDSATSSSSSA